MLSAIPLPEAGRRNRRKTLPRGEIPDAAHPPAGCRFHPRCPEAFGSCGWQGQDLIDVLEDRWTEVDSETFTAELALFGKLADADVGMDHVRFPSSTPDTLAEWLREHGPELPANVFSAVTGVEADVRGVTVRFGTGPEPDVRHVKGRDVACHLHGITVRPDGVHVGEPEA